ncbi:MAG: leucine-rich repeat domain-containing protein [Clostridia bacterium]|nr:leucine-rich repeat domain-containing protein [Clostridia bacterium]
MRYGAAIPHRLIPLYVYKINDTDSEIIRLSSKVMSDGYEKSVIGFFDDVLKGNTSITDLIIPYPIREFAEGLLEGCSNLKRITIPKGIHKIDRNFFKGCDSLEDVYFQGTKEQWDNVKIYWGERIIEFGDLIPGSPVSELKSDRFEYDNGNEPLLKATIHFNCEF